MTNSVLKMVDPAYAVTPAQQIDPSRRVRPGGRLSPGEDQRIRFRAQAPGTMFVQRRVERLAQDVIHVLAHPPRVGHRHLLHVIS